MDKVKNILVHLYRASQDLLFFIIKNRFLKKKGTEKNSSMTNNSSHTEHSFLAPYSLLLTPYLLI